MHQPHELDVHALTRRLRRNTRAEVRFDEGSRALYATDASNYRQVPIGVVIPRDVKMCWKLSPPAMIPARRCCAVAVAPALPANVATWLWSWTSPNT